MLSLCYHLDRVLVQHDACLDQFHGIQGFPSSEGADVRRVSIRINMFLLHPILQLV